MKGLAVSKARFRRSAISRKILAGVGGVTALTLALAGCGGGGAVNGESPSTDTLTLALNGPPVSFDPARADNGNGVIYSQLAYDPLIRGASDGTLQPGLATEWGYVGDGNTEFEMTIREDVTFSDGDAVTPEAVANSLNYYFQNSSGPAGPAWAGAEATAGDGTVTITLDQPNPIVADMLTERNLAGNIVSPAGLADPESLQSVPAGAGPYVLDADETVAGDTYTYTKNPDFWDDSRQNWETIVIKVMPSPTSALQALRTGQVDFMFGTPQTAETAESAGLQLFDSPSTWEGMFILDRAGELVPALADVRVRQALNYAIDRDAIANALYGEFGRRTVQPNTEGWDGYVDSLADAYPYDPDKARDLLAEAGYGEGFSIPVNYFNVGQIEAMLQSVSSQLQEIGVTLELNPNPDMTAYIPMLTSKEMAGSSLTFGGQPEFINAVQCWLPTSVLNPFAVNDQAFVDLVAKAASAPPEESAALMEDVAAYTVEQAYTLPVVQANTIYFAREGLEGIELNPQGGRVNPLDWSN
jgi:peptide/nickel transport system substrate-binding protein